MNKKWKKEDVLKILELRKQGVKFRNIGLFFSVTSNAVRKTLQRHTNIYTKKFINLSTIRTKKEIILNWGIKNNIIKRNNDTFFIEKEIISEYKAIIEINKFRLKNNLIPFLMD